MNKEERFTLLLVLISLSWARALGIYALKGPLFQPCGKRHACASACKSVCILCCGTALRMTVPPHCFLLTCKSTSVTHCVMWQLINS